MEPEQRPWTWQDEENLLLEVSEDRRLWRLGIDPDADQLTIWLELKKRKDAIDAGREKRRIAIG